MRKIYGILLALILLTVSAYAVISPNVGGQKFAANDDNFGREHIDIIVRNFPDDRNVNIASPSTIGSIASEGAIVVWATQDSAIIGRDITMTDIATSSLVAGIISESGGIASGAFGRMRIYGYFDDVIVADAFEPSSRGEYLITSKRMGMAVGAATSIPNAGILLGDGTGSDQSEIQAMVNMRN